MKKRVLVIGKSVSAEAFAKKMAEQCEVYLTSVQRTPYENIHYIDIREDAETELLDFVLEQNINLTVVISAKSLLTNIVNLFSSHNQPIFAPGKNVCNVINDKIFTKKMLYKLKIPTPRFGIFEKQNLAFEYIQKNTFPCIIKTNEPSSAVIVNTPQAAKNILESVFVKQNAEVIIEDYIPGQNFSFYAITDGYNALPFGSSLLYKHLLEGNGGQLTGGMGACSPCYKLSLKNENYIMNNVIYPTLNYLERNYGSYIGIIGVDGILRENGSIQILSYHNFMQDCDSSAILNSVEEDIYNLTSSCILGSFSDDYNIVKQNNLASTSVVLKCKNKNNNENIIHGMELFDENTKYDLYPPVTLNADENLEVSNGNVMVLTSSGRTVTEATEKVYDEVRNINFDGILYRKDICKQKYCDNY